MSHTRGNARENMPSWFAFRADTERGASADQTFVNHEYACMYMHACVCMHVYIYTYIYIYIYMYVYVYVYACLFMHVYVCMCMYACNMYACNFCYKFD